MSECLTFYFFSSDLESVFIPRTSHLFGIQPPHLKTAPPRVHKLSFCSWPTVLLCTSVWDFTKLSWADLRFVSLCPASARCIQKRAEPITVTDEIIDHNKTFQGLWHDFSDVTVEKDFLFTFRNGWIFSAEVTLFSLFHTHLLEETQLDTNWSSF